MPDEDSDSVTLWHLKAPHTEPKDIGLRFERTLQRFEPLGDADGDKPSAGKIQSALAALWDKTPLMADGEKGEDG